jgi:hypothetical protein
VQEDGRKKKTGPKKAFLPFCRGRGPLAWGLGSRCHTGRIKKDLPMGRIRNATTWQPLLYLFKQTIVYIKCSYRKIGVTAGFKQN